MKCGAKSLQFLYKSIKRFEFIAWLLCCEEFHRLHTFSKQEFAEIDRQHHQQQSSQQTDKNHRVTKSNTALRKGVKL